MDRTFALMSDDPDMGPKLRDADTPQRFEFTDFDLVVNIRAGGADEPNLAWEWSDEIDWEPKVRMAMSSAPPTATSRARRTWPSRSLGGVPAAATGRAHPITKPCMSATAG